MLPENHPDSYHKHEEIRATHPFYACWYNMVQRCCNPRHVSFSHYGARGVRVASEWLQFAAFYGDMYASWRSGLEIERIDNDEGYSPENCTWATRAQQCRNKRNNKLSEEEAIAIRKMKGSYTNKQVGEMYCISPSHVCRIQNGEKWAA